MNRKIRIYIASPYSNGWHADNVRRQLEAKHILMDNGFVPFAPLENHFSEIYRHRRENEWLNWDLEWLSVCDILVRIRAFYSNGNEIPSAGVDIEVERANNLNIPVFVFENIDHLKMWSETVDKIKLWNFANTEIRNTSLRDELTINP